MIEGARTWINHASFQASCTRRNADEHKAHSFSHHVASSPLFRFWKASLALSSMCIRKMPQFVTKEPCEKLHWYTGISNHQFWQRLSSAVFNCLMDRVNIYIYMCINIYIYLDVGGGKNNLRFRPFAKATFGLFFFCCSFWSGSISLLRGFIRFASWCSNLAVKQGWIGSEIAMGRWCSTGHGLHSPPVKSILPYSAQ